MAFSSRVAAGWNQLLCLLSTGLDSWKNDSHVDICFMGLKGGLGAMKGTDGDDHIGLIDAPGGVLDKAREAYGVVLDEKTFELDEGETAQVRGGAQVCADSSRLMMPRTGTGRLSRK